jgi:tRNA(fMet)-specific endonuclease VapC
MATFVLDTDMLSLYQRDHQRVVAAVAMHSVDVIAVASDTLEEQISGWSALARSAKSPQQHEHAAMFLAALVVSWNRFALLPLTVAAIARFQQLVKTKLNVKRNDLRIAATTFEVSGTLVTRNRRDFGRIPGLPIEDWSV